MVTQRKKMRSDWGTVTEVRKGVWRIRYWAQTSDGYRRCSETVRGTRRQAGDRLAELRVRHGHDAPCPTLQDCWAEWYLPDRERMVSQGDLAPQTLIQYRSTWRRHVGRRWEGAPVDQIRPIDVQQWLLSLKRVASESSLHLMRQILDYPVRYGILKTNPMSIRYLLPSPSTTDRREDGIWTPDELGDVWHACWGSWFEPAVLLSGFGGCRVGEALGVRTEDVRGGTVDGTTVAYVSIARQIDNRNDEASRTKNRWSTRTAILAGRPAQRLVQLAKLSGEGGYVTRCGTRPYATQRELRNAFAQALDEHGIARHLFKNLRKTWQTNARWVLRLPPWIIEPMMGHVGEGVTNHHYDRPTEEYFAQTLASAWRERPFGDLYPWLP